MIMNEGKICVPVCGETAGDVVARMDLIREVADITEIRFDSVLPSEIEPLLEKVSGRDEQFLFTFRPIEQGGSREIPRSERIRFWRNIAARFGNCDRVLVDIEYDLNEPLGFDEEQVIVSRHEFHGFSGELSDVHEAFLLFPSGCIKCAVMIDDASDAVDVWRMLSEFGRSVIPIAMGEAGKWTRILGLAYFAPLTYASLDASDATAPGQISAKDLLDVFRVKELSPRSHIYAVIAGDTSYSLSPFMHNAAFKSEGLDSVFVPMQVRNLDAFMSRMVKGATREVELHFKGFSVTNPHKQSVMKYLDTIDETARKIGAVNTIKIESGKLHGFNTDVDGFIRPLKKLYGDLKDARAAVVGAGGAARACIYALQRERADVRVFTRDPKKAVALSKEFGIVVEALTTDNTQLRTQDILVNATPLGTKGELEHETIATSDELRGIKLVYDLVYNPAETRLINEAKAAGVQTLGGIEMLLAQGARQFQIWTGREAPIEEMRAAVEKRLI